MPNMAVKIRIGDWSHDGHGMTADFIIKCNFNGIYLSNQYERGVKKIGVDVRRLCADYEAHTITRADADKLMPYDKIYEMIEGVDDRNEDRYYIDKEGYVIMWLETARVGDPQINYTFAKESEVLGIGGYGLFTE